jgi:hypothetical protein
MTWKVWAIDDDELCFEFMDGEKHVIVSIERDQFGYAVKRGDKFEPGRYNLDCAGMVADEINDAI